MITHTVLFRLKRPVDPAVAASFAETVRAFGAEPPHALGPAEVLVDAELRPEGRSVTERGLTVRFAGAEEFAAYIADPKHVAFVDDALIPLCESWLSIQVEG